MNVVIKKTRLKQKIGKQLQRILLHFSNESRRKVFISLLVLFLLSPLILFLVSSVYAASSPWIQTDWSGGSGQTSWSDATKFDSSSNVTTSTTGQITLNNPEKLSNTGFESDLTGWTSSTQTLTLQPSAAAGLDTRIISDIAGNNFGTSTVMSSGKASSGGGIFRSMLQFDVSSIPSTATITTGTVTLTWLAGDSATDYNVGLHRGLTQWFEGSQNNVAPPGGQDGSIWNLRNANGSVQWGSNTAGGLSGTDYASSATATTLVTGSGTTFNWNITSDVAAWVSGSATNYGDWLINASEGTAGSKKNFPSSDNASAADRPKLVVNYTFANRSTTTTYNGSTGSVQLAPGSNGAGTFTQSVNVGNTSTHNLSVYAYTDGSAVTSSDLSLYYNGSTVSTTYTSVGGGWYALTGSVTGVASSVGAGVQVASGKTVYLDNFSVSLASGTLTSSIFDSGQVSDWGTLTYNATIPTNTSVTVKARSSNSSSMSGATAFSSCAAILSGSDISANNCITDGHRYIQYQLTLSNTDPAPTTPTFQDISIAFTISSSAAPSITLTPLNPDPNTDATPTIAGTATDAVDTVSAVQFQMDSTVGSWSACTADDGNFNQASETFTCTASSLSDGAHTMYVRATDSNANTTSSGLESNDTFTIDTTAPSIPGTPSTTTPTADTTPTWTWTASTDATSGLASTPYTVQWSQSSSFSSGVSSSTSATNSFTHSTPLAAGTWYFRAKAADVVGNESNYSSNGSTQIFTGSLNTGITAFWKLDETTGATRNDSVGTNHLTNNNSVSQIAGKIGNASHFTAASSQYASIPDNADVGLNNTDFTFSSWVYLDSKSGNLTILNKGDGQIASTEEVTLRYLSSTDTFRFTIGGSTFNSVNSTSFGSPALNTWYFLVIWYDGSADTINIQVNNGNINSVAQTTGTIRTSKPFEIGRFNTNGSYMDGRIDAVGMWKRVLTSDERVELYNIGLGKEYPFDGIMPASISINTPKSYQVFQRSNTNKSDITISGTYTGTPTSIEASWNGGSYSTIVASPTGGSFSGTLANQDAGQGTLTVRFANDTSTSTTTNYIGVGDIFVVAGQSNAEGNLTNLQSYTHPTLKASKYPETGGWQNMTDPTDSDKSTVGSYWPLLASRYLADQNVPVAFITVAEDGTGLGDPDPDWQKGNIVYQNAVTTIQSSGVNGIKAILWHQGEHDIALGTTQANYQTELSQMVDDLQTDLGFPNMKLVSAQVGPAWAYSLSDSDKTLINTIRLAQTNRWNNDPDILPGPSLYDIDIFDGGAPADGVHFRTNIEGQTAANRWWAALQKNFYSGVDGRGPILSTAEYNASKTQIILTFTDDSFPLLPSGSLTAGGAGAIGGFEVRDNNVPVTISSVTRIANNKLQINLSAAASGTLTVSLGSGNDGEGAVVPTDSSAYNLPAETFINHATTQLDETAPSGGSVSYTDGYRTTTSVSLTVSDGTDSGSGINTSTRIVQRASATLSGGTCGSYGSFGTITPSGTHPNFTDSTVSSGNCYKYQYLVSDNNSNQATYTSSNVAKIDTSLPSTPGTPSTTTPTASSSQTWNWTASTDAVSGVASYSWRTTGTAIVTGSTATNSVITSLGEGTYSFFVKAVDSAGNQGAESLAGTVVIDQTGPTTPGTPSTSSVASDTTPTWNWTASTDSSSGVDHYVFEWCTDSGFSGCGSNTANAASNTYTHTAGITNGTWYVRVKAIDAVGNESSYSSNGSQLINTTAPIGSVVINSGTSFVNNTSVTLTLSAVDDIDTSGSLQMKISNDSGFVGAVYESYATSKPWTLSSGADGVRTVYVMYKDTSTNESDVYSDTITLDTTAPSIPGTPTTTTPTTDTTPGWNWTASTDSGSGLSTTPYTVQWCQDSSFTGCSGNTDTSNTNSYTNGTLAEGTWYFKVKAVDNATNESGYSSNGQVLIDTTAPSGPSSLASSNHTISTWSSDNTINITWTAATDSGSGLAGYSYIFDTASSTDPDTTQDIGMVTNVTSGTLSDGNSHYFHIRAVDNLGNWGSTVSVGPFFIDTTPPTVSGTPSTTSPTNDNTPTWSWTASTDADSGLATNSYTVQWCKDSSFTGCNSNTDTSTINSYTHTTVLTAGTWYIKVKAIDAVGNESAYSPNGTVVIDTAFPTGSISINSGATKTTSRTVTLTISATDNLSSSSNIQMKVSNLSNLSDASYESFASSKLWTLTSGEGTKAVYINFKDQSGNESTVYSDNIIFNLPPSTPETPQIPVQPVTPTPEIPKPTDKPDVEKPTMAQGYTVKIKLVDENGRPIVGAKVEIHSTPQTGNTDAQGVIAFNNIEEGKHNVIISYDGKTVEQEVTITGDDKSQEITITIKPTNIFLTPEFIVSAIIALIVVAGLFYALIKKKKKEDEAISYHR